MRPVDEIDRSCTFCKLKKILPPPEETFKHLFWDCPVTTDLTSKFFEKITPEFEHLPENEKLLFWFTGLHLNAYPPLLNIARCIFLYTLWDMHNRKCVLGWTTFKKNFFFEFFKITELSTDEKLGIGNAEYFLTRRFEIIKHEEAVLY